jgi:hypothetical protein
MTKVNRNDVLARAVNAAIESLGLDDMSAAKRRRASLALVAATGVIGLIAPASHAALQSSTAPLTLGTDWPLPSPSVDTVAPYYPADIFTPPPTNSVGVPEGAVVLSQTFTPTSSFKLGAFGLLATGGNNTPSVHLFDLGNLGASPVPSSYTPSGGDLLGGGSGLSYTYNASQPEYVTLTVTGNDQVNLLAGHTYAFEQWQATAGTSYWIRTAGTTYVPPNGSDPSTATPIGNPYLPGDAYTGATANAVTSRGELNGAGRDFIAAVFSTASLPPFRVDINGGPNVDARPNQAGWASWTNLPTSGNQGSGPQQGYPTLPTDATLDTVTTTIAAGTMASGLVTSTLHSADVQAGVGGAPAYYLPGPGGDSNPKINSHDWSITGREFDNSGNFTPTKDYVYRDFAVAESSTAFPTNGSNHRMEIKLEGLDPKTTYKLKFYSYDNSNRLGVSVFTDVTKQPLVFLPQANSTDGNFTPGDGTGGTQYAPSGQYIDGFNGGTVPTYPTTDDFRAVSVYATTDANGMLIFAESTVVGLAGATQTLPVLNGYEVIKDERGWNGGTGTNWSNINNWAGTSIPNGKGQCASFGTSANTTVAVDTAVTVGRLAFSGSSFTIGGAGTLTLDDTSINYALAGSLTPASGNGRTRIDLASTAGNQTISAPLVLTKDTEIDTAGAAGQTLTLSNLQPSSVIVTKSDAGTLAVNNLRAAGLRAVGGTVRILPDGSANGVSHVTNLGVAAGAKIDITNNKLVTAAAVGTWNGSDYTGVTGLIKSGRNGGGWGGTTGIVTSQTQAIAGNLTTIGVAAASQVKGIAATATATATWAGQTVTGSDSLVMYTYGGDANLDGKINVDDYTRIDFNVPLGASGWYNGDFNYDGKINVDDYTIIDFNVGIQGAPFFTAGGAGGLSATAVPEPTSLAAISLAAGALLARRRRR